MEFLNQNDEFDIYNSQYFNNPNFNANNFNNDMNNFNSFSGMQNNMMYNMMQQMFYQIMTNPYLTQQLFNAMSNILASQYNQNLMINPINIMPKPINQQMNNIQQPINMEEFDEEEM